VEERTAELHQSNLALQSANGRLKNNFLTSIKLFTALIELRDDRLAGHSRRVADSARRLAHAMALDTKQVQEVFVAGLLHGIGMVGFDDALLQTPVASMSPRQLEVFRKHPARAEQLLMPLAELKPVLQIIAAQMERFDGSGYPEGSSGRHIPLGARILAVASDYDSMQIGLLEPHHLSPRQAQELLHKRSGHAYDASVVEAFLNRCVDQVEQVPADSAPTTRAIGSADLVDGMVLAQDLSSPTGMLLLVSGHVLDAAVISKIIAFERSIETRLTLHVVMGST